MNKYVIEKDKLINNINIIKSMTESTIIAMIKCNGYGLGLMEYAEILVENGIKILAVSSCDEAVKLKNSFPDTDVLLLTSYSTNGEALEIVKNNIIATVGSVASAIALDKAGQELGVVPYAHIELNTGMGRCGFDCCDTEKILSLKKYNINFCGTFSHFSYSFSKKAKNVEAPLKLFNETIIKLQENDFNTGFTHIANSSAFIKYPQSHLDGVRIGSAFLGRIIEDNHLGLQKIGYLESEIIETNFLKKGSNIGYGNTFKTKKDTKTAIIPVGYAYGFMTEKSRDTFRLRDIARYILNDIKPRKFYCRINNKKCEILGRIGMFNIICDITDKNAEIGDKVILDANPILISDSIKRDYI